MTSKDIDSNTFINKFVDKFDHREAKAALAQLIERENTLAIAEALTKRDTTVKLTVAVVLTPDIGKEFLEYYDGYKEFDQQELSQKENT